MRVVLVAVNIPIPMLFPEPSPGLADPRRLVLLAVKTSQGKLWQKGVEHYISRYPSDRVGEWIVKASEFPSVLEHIVFTFFIDGVTRVCSHQLVRHRLASYTQESQRYSEERIIMCLECLAQRLYQEHLENIERSYGSRAVDSEARLVEMVLLEHDIWLSYSRVISDLLNTYAYLGVEDCLGIAFDTERCDRETLLRSLQTYVRLRMCGKPAEEARYVLPQCTKTSLLMTVNLRELIHIACLRLSPRAQNEIRELVSKMVEQVKTIVPEIEVLIEKMCRER